MAASRDVTTNRNGAFGDLEAYAPVRLTLEEIIDARRHPKKASGERVSTVLFETGGYRLVRYRLGTEEVGADMGVVFPENRVANWHAADRAAYSALYGVLDETGAPQAVIDVIRDKLPSIHMVFGAPAADLPSQTMLAILDYLDIPASRRVGADQRIHDLYDARWDKHAGRRTRVPPVHVVVKFERLCFATSPALRETVDVILAPDPAQDLSSPDADHAYWARDHYRDAAWEHLSKMPQSGARPGFSSWLNHGDPSLAKVVGDALDREIAELFADVPGEVPGGPKP